MLNMNVEVFRFSDWRFSVGQVGCRVVTADFAAAQSLDLKLNAFSTNAALVAEALSLFLSLSLPPSPPSFSPYLPASLSLPLSPSLSLSLPLSPSLAAPC